MFAALMLCLFVSNTLATGHWQKQEANTLAWLRSVYFLNENKGWIAGSHGTLLTTEDGGANWTQVKTQTENNLLDVVFLNDQEGWLLCESDAYQLQRGEPRTYLLFTNDSGKNWRRVFLDGYSRDLRVSRIIFSREGKGWLLGENGTFYTTNNDNEWIGKPAPTRFLLLGGALMNSQQGVLVGAASTIVYTNDGITWRNANIKFKTQNTNKEPVSIRFTSISFADNQNGWAVGFGGQIYATNDGGKNWFAQESNVNENLNDVKFINDKEGFAIGDNGTLLYTNNKGYKWERVYTGTTHKLERIFFITPERGWIVGFGGTILTYTADNKNPQLKNN